MTSRVQKLSLDADPGAAGLRTVAGLYVSNDGVNERVVGAAFPAEILDFDQDWSASRIPKK